MPILNEERFKWNLLNQEEDPLVSKRTNTADEFELTMSQKKKKKILMDETSVTLSIFLVDIINSKWQVKGKLGHMVQTDERFAVCHKRWFELLKRRNRLC